MGQPSGFTGELMADIDLNGLNDKEVLALQEAINRRNRSKVDWDNMTDAERAYRNRTVEPRTPMVPYQEYPKVIYGNINGQVQSVTVANEAQEDYYRDLYPHAEWDKSMRDHGLITCPSKVEGLRPVALVGMGAASNPAVDVRAQPDENPAPPPSYEDQMHPLAKKRGRPPKAREDAAA